jgi:hypothetical protein
VSSSARQPADEHADRPIRDQLVRAKVRNSYRAWVAIRRSPRQHLCPGCRPPSQADMIVAASRAHKGWVAVRRVDAPTPVVRVGPEQGMVSPYGGIGEEGIRDAACGWRRGVGRNRVA